MINEEESFVILGTSPSSSITSYISINNDDKNRIELNSLSLENDVDKTNIISQQNGCSEKDLLVSSTSKRDETLSLLNINSMLNKCTAVSLDDDVDMLIMAKPILPNQDKIKNGNQIQNEYSLKREHEFNGVGANNSNVSVIGIEATVSGTDVCNNKPSSINSSQQIPLKTPLNSLNSCSLLQKSEGISDISLERIKPQALFRNNSLPNSFAASFLLGDVNIDIKDVFQHFPSLERVGAQTDDLIKLQNLILDYNTLKENLNETNAEMKKYINIFQEWTEQIKKYKELQSNGAEQSKEWSMLIVKLRDENTQLKKELDETIANLRFNCQSIQEENEDLRKTISEKSSLIQNISAEVEKLIQEKHISFECAKNHGEHVEKSSKGKYFNFIAITEHERIVKDKLEKISKLTAENDLFQEQKTGYIDEINRLKMDLDAVEEQLKILKNDPGLLKYYELAKKYELENKDLKEENSLLRTQVEIYGEDYKIEREHNQKLIEEKNQILSDLKMLQGRNQKLIEELEQSRFDKKANKNTENLKNIPSTSKLRKDHGHLIDGNDFVSELHVIGDEQRKKVLSCPLCGKKFFSVDFLVDHTQKCICT